MIIRLALAILPLFFIVSFSLPEAHGFARRRSREPSSEGSSNNVSTNFHPAANSGVSMNTPTKPTLGGLAPTGTVVDPNTVAPSTVYTGTASFRNRPTTSGASRESAVTQREAQIQAAQISESSSTQVVSIGVASCAEGANSIGSDQVKSGVLIASCLQSFDTASDLKGVAGIAANNAGVDQSSSLSADSALLASESGQKIFDELHNKYGTEKDAFTEKLIAARGDPEILGTQESLDALFNGKISRDQVNAALEAAGNLTAAERQKILDSSLTADLRKEIESGLIKAGGKFAKQSGKSSLRDSLMERLTRAEEASPSLGQTAMNRSPASSSKALFSNLQPSENPFFESQNQDEQGEMASDDSTGGLTLFEIIHNKLLEKLRTKKVVNVAKP
jgi:hypothetical protein